jgi:hypothetical protein
MRQKYELMHKKLKLKNASRIAKSLNFTHNAFFTT